VTCAAACHMHARQRRDLKLHESVAYEGHHTTPATFPVLRRQQAFTVLLAAASVQIAAAVKPEPGSLDTVSWYNA